MKNQLITWLVLLTTAMLSAAEKTNILFIAIDDLKPTLGCYGDQIAKTPEIDKLASRGTVFLNAQCQWPVCGPSRASLMTSLYPEAVGVMDLKTDMRKKNPNVLTLPQHFHQHGYISAGTGKIYDPRCVDDKKNLDNPSWSLPFRHQNYKKVKLRDAHQVVLAPDVADADLMDGQIALDGVKLMKQLAAEDKPFFLAVGFKKPHLPFIAPKKYWDLYQRDSFTVAEHQGGIENDSGYVIHDSPEFRGYDGAPETGPIAEDLQLEAIHGYYACTSFIDAQVGLLTKQLEKLNLAETTAIVLWGDHGFHLGDHDMWGKHSALEQAARVPLIMIPPAGSKSPKQSTAPIELTDIFPTLCAWADIPIPKDIAGRNFGPLLSGGKERIREGALTVFNKKGAIGYSYRTERYRYNEWINKFGKTVARDLFDYQTDPLETKNLAADPDHSDLIEKLAKSLRLDSLGCDRLHGKIEKRKK